MSPARRAGGTGRTGRKGRRRSQPTQVKTLVSRVLGDLGLEAVARAHQVGERWEEAVGPEIARHCRPVALRGGVLEARVDSSVWCQQLQLQSPEILAALGEVMGEEAPTSIRFQVGNIAASRAPSGPRSGGR